MRNLNSESSSFEFSQSKDCIRSHSLALWTKTKGLQRFHNKKELGKYNSKGKDLKSITSKGEEAKKGLKRTLHSPET